MSKDKTKKQEDKQRLTSDVDAVVRWRPWPQEKPEYEVRYLIYYKQHGIKRTFIADYLPIEERWTNTLDAEILLWAEYNKPEEQDA